MSIATHETRPDTGFSSAQLGLYLFLAADAMFYGALFSSYALLRTAAETWERGHGLVVGGLGGAAMVALAAAALAPRLSVRPHRLIVISFLLALLFSLGLEGALHTLDVPPAKSTYWALVCLFNLVLLLHLIGGLAVGTWIWLRDGRTPDAPEAAARLGLTAVYAGATLLFAGGGLAMLLWL